SYWGEDTNPLSLNLYTYCENDPIQYVDPTGHWQESDNSMNSEAKARISKYTDDYYKAKAKGDKAGMDKAHADAEALREAYKKNTSGSSSGSKGGSSGKSSGSRSSSGGSSKSSGSSSKKSSDRITVTWEGYIIDINISELEEYRSHGWGEFKGKAYTDNMYNSSQMLDTITIASDTEARIYNYGNIGTVNTGKGSYTVIDKKGSIGTINTGMGSTTIISNSGKVAIIKSGDNSHTEIYNKKEYDEGVSIGSIVGGKRSSSIVFNYGSIDDIRTGEESENLVFNFEEIESIATGLNNSTILYDNKKPGYVEHERQRGNLVVIGQDTQGTGKGIGTQGKDISYIEQSLNQLVYGNYTDDVTILGTGLQILSGFIGIDLPADIRDITADLKSGDIGMLTIDTIAIFPVVGSFKYVDEVGTLIKNGDEITTAIKGAGSNVAKGWKVGDPIDNLTKAGNQPSWSAVRQRYWKNEAFNNPKNYSPENITRMQKGLAPQRFNELTGTMESMELHHIIPQRSNLPGINNYDNLRSVWPDEHQLIDPYRKTGR
nr:hypothetical protein [Sedimentibacter sp.]